MSPKQKWLAITCICLMFFLINIDATAVNLALAHIAKDFNAKLSTLQWVINGFLLSTTALIIFSGRLGDSFGRRRIFLIGTSIFLLASVIAVIAPNIQILIFGRILQGVGLAFISPQMMSIATSIFPPEQKAFAVGIISSTAGFSQAIGPTLGGFLLHVLNWRWIFLINLPVGIIILFLAVRTLPKMLDNVAGGKIDYIGAALTILIIGLLIFILNEVTNLNLSLLIFLIVTFFFLLLVFFLYEKKVSNPLIQFKLFAKRNFVLTLIIRFCVNYGFGVFLFIFGLYLQNIQDFSAIKTGILLLSASLIFGGLSPISGKIVDRIGERLSFIIGMFSLTIGFFWAAQFFLGSSIINLIIPLMLIGFGWSVSVPASVSSALKSVPPAQSSLAIGILYSIAVFLPWVVSVAVTGFIITLVAKHNFFNLLAEAQIYLTSAQNIIVSKLYTATQSQIQFLNLFGTNPQTIQITQIAKSAFVRAYEVVMLLTAGVHLIGLICSFFLREYKEEV